MQKSQVVSKSVADYRFLISLLVMSVMVCAVFAGQPDMFWPQVEHQRATQAAISLYGDRVSLQGLFNSSTGAPVRVRGGFEGETMNINPDREEMIEFIDSHWDMFRISSENLDIIRSSEVAGKSIFTARQKMDGRPVPKIWD